jgi:hypothetical protein
MSQGTIIRKSGQEKPSEMDEPKGTFPCSCGEVFIIHHHRAHPENLEEHKAWLAAELEKEHARDAKHKDSYRFPY